MSTTPKRESLDKWRERQALIIAEQAAQVPPELQPLANVLLHAGLHNAADLKLVITDNADRIERLEAAVQRLDDGLGVSEIVDDRTMEQLAAMEAHLGPSDRERGTLAAQVADLRRAGRRRDWFILGVGLLALLDLLLLALSIEFGPTSMGGGLIAFLTSQP